MAVVFSKSSVNKTILPIILQKASSPTLMRLPTEIRLQIIEHLLRDLSYHFDCDNYCSLRCVCRVYIIEEVSVQLPIGLFQTCSQLRHEALNVLRHKGCLYLHQSEVQSEDLARYTPHLHPLLLQNISKVRMEKDLVNFENLMDTFPCLDTVMSIEPYVRFKDFPDYSVPDAALVGAPDAESSNGVGKDVWRLRVAKGLHCLLERSIDLEDPAKNFKFKLHNTPGALQRPLKVLFDVNIFVDNDNFHGKFDVYAGVFATRPGWPSDFEGLDNWLEDLEV